MNDRDAEGGEVGPKAGGDAMGMVGTEGYDVAVDDRLSGEDKGVVAVDRVDELGADGLAYAHGEMIVNLNRQWSSGWNGDALRRTSGHNTCQHAQS